MIANKENTLSKENELSRKQKNRVNIKWNEAYLPTAVKVLTLLLLAFVYNTASATTCNKAANDWVAPICNLTESPGTRCSKSINFKSFCNNATVGCAEIGGCFGFTPPGHWYPLVDNNQVPRWRCRCGCFADNTVFSGLSKVTGKDIIRTKGKGILIEGADKVDFATSSYFEINGVSHAPDKESYFIYAGDREIILSDSHPVVVVNEKAEITSVKAAENIAEGDLLLSEEGRPLKVERIEIKKYDGGELMNFNVKSQRPENHFVVANGLWMGDAAWQEVIHAHASKVLLREDILKYLENQNEIK